MGLLEIEKLLLSLIEIGVRFSVKNENLIVEGKLDRVDKATKMQIKENKSAIIQYLNSLKVSGVTIKPRENATNTAPLSFSQQRLWFIETLEPDSVKFNMPASFRIHGTIDMPALQKAFTALIERHQVLRSVYRTDDEGDGYQLILPIDNFSISQLDISRLEEAAREEELVRLADEDALTPFNIAEDFMLRVSLIKMADDDFGLLMNTHHIASDGWSASIVLSEFMQLYMAFQEGRANPLEELPIQYADFATWQRDWIKGDVLKSHIHYWVEQLRGIPTVHSIPLDRMRPTEQDFTGDSVYGVIPKEVVSRLETLAKAQDSTLFMAMNAAFSTFVSRLSGERDVVLGTPIANREYSELEGLVGFFVNTLVLRSDLSDNPTFNQLLTQSKMRCLGAYGHQQIPFEAIVDEISPERTLSHAPIFQILIALQNTESPSAGGADDEPSTFGGLSFGEIDSSEISANYDLSLDLQQIDDGLLMRWDYATSIFDEERIETMAAQFTQLLAILVESPDERVLNVAILNDDEEAQLLEWNQTEKPFPDQQCFHELIEQQVAAHPEQIALIHKDTRVTYAQMNARANQIAHLLVEQGVKPDHLIGLCVHRSPEMLIAALGIMKAGCAYVPLDPTYPAQRLEYIIENSQVDIVVTQNSTRSLISGDEARVLCFDEHAADIAAAAQTNITPSSLGLTNQHLAYTIYTSGSTGEPKGTLLTHRGLCNMASAMAEMAHLDTSSTVMQFASISFDVAVKEWTMALVSGASLVLIDKDDTMSPEAIETAYETHQVSHGIFTPAVLAVLDESRFSSLKYLFVGGEACAVPLADKWSANRVFMNAYGPSEVTVCSSVGRYEPGQSALHMGKPVANTRSYVLDEFQQPVPIGVVGELYIGGAGVGRGYLHRPGLTDDKFLPDPYTEETNAKMYRTGDLVRWLPSGDLMFVGRVDHQVKIRGFRIELGEVEAGLLNDSRVKEAVVVAREKEQCLFAYVVSDSADDLNIELRKSLFETLPDYMVPAIVTVIDEIPKNPNGKVDKKALPEPDMSLLAGEYVAPETDIEKKLTEIWSRILDLDEDVISSRASFFDLGGHSLLATKVLSAVRSEYHVDLPVKVLFEEQTIHALAGAIELASSSDIPALLPAQTRHMQPLSFAQQRLWLIDRIEPGSAQYIMPVALKVAGTLNTEALQKALNKILERHEVLRTTYHANEEGEGFQYIHDDVEVPFSVEDLSTLAEDERALMVQRLTMREANRPFNLESDMMLRAVVVKETADIHTLLITLHHIASDGWSMSILNSELFSCYQAYSNGEEPTLAPLDIQYGDFAIWQRNWIQGKVLEDQVNYWVTELSGVPQVHHIPLDKTRPEVQSYRGDDFTHGLDEDITAGLNLLARKHNASLFMVLNAAFAALFARYSGEKDIVMGTSSANRDISEIEPVIGFFINTLLLRTDLSDNPSFNQLVEQSRRKVLSAFEHQQIPFEAIVEELQPERTLSFNPLFQLMLTLHNQSVTETDAGTSAASDDSDDDELELVPTEQGYSAAQFDISLDVTEMDEVLIVSWQFATDIFSKSTIERMAQHFEALLRAMIAEPDHGIFGLHMLLPHEEHILLHEFNGIEKAYGDLDTIPARFEQCVEATPDEIAVVHEGHGLTYSQVNGLANQLAHYLRAQGIGSEPIAENSRFHADAAHYPKRLVAIYAERSPKFLIAILGVMKAGGAYVPIDPINPQGRVDYMLQDSGASVVITEQKLLSKVQVAQGTLVVCMEEAEELLEDQPHTNISNDLTADSPAYMIYTSGSTGRPKGALVHHAGALNHIDAEFDVLGFRTEDGSKNAPTNFLQSAASSSDVSVWQFLAPVICGGRTVIINDTTDVPQLLDLVHSNHIHFVEAAPVVAQLIVDHASLLSPEELDLPSWRWLMTTGDALPVPLVNEWLKVFSNVSVMNGYGPTEASDDITQYQIEQPLPSDLESVPIGGALPNFTMYVLNDHMQLQPIGVPGELCVSGVGVGLGYWNNQEKTDEVFVANPYGGENSPVHGDVIYRTGDLGRWLPEGQIAFMGRADNQVKIRGFRLELGEVEAQLSAIDGVSDVAVLVHKNHQDQKALAAYLTHKPGSDITTDAVREELKRELPDYMIPSSFTWLERMPLNAADKIDRHALPDPDFAGEIAEQYAKPQSEVERKLCSVWQTVLGQPRIGIDDNFFAIGGDSILSVQVVSRANKIDVYISTRQLFEFQTIRELAKNASTKQVVVAHQEASDGEQVLLPIQAEYFDRNDVDDHHYNQAMMFTAPSSLQLAEFHQVLRALYERHDVLRLGFERYESGEWHAKYQPLSDDMIARCVQIVDVTTMDDDARIATMQDVAEQAQASLSLADADVCRAVWFKGKGANSRMLLVLHHLVVDGVSWRIIGDDLNQALQLLLTGQEVRLDSKTSSYQQWGHFLLNYSRGAALQAQKAFWLTQLNVPVARLDGSTATVDAPFSSTAIHKVTLNAQVTSQLLTQAHQAYNTQINDLLLSGLYLAIQRWRAPQSDGHGQSNLRVDLEGHGREELTPTLDFADTLGWFTSVYPLVMNADDDASLEDLLIHVKEKIRAIPAKGLGFGLLAHLAKDADIVAANAQQPADIVFNYLGNTAADLPVEDDEPEEADNVNELEEEILAFVGSEESVGNVISPNRQREYPIGLNGSVVDGELYFEIDYNEQQYSAERIAELGEAFNQALTDIVAHCVEPDVGCKTPSDYPLAQLSLSELRDIQVTYPNLEDIYQSTPMQQGMLFHSLLDKASYVTRITLTLQENIQLEAFRAAWNTVVQRHAIYRTAFVGEPAQQVVLSSVDIPWLVEDWRHLSDDARAEKLAAYEYEDKQRGFDVTQAPLLRISLFRLAEEEYAMVMSYHHVLLDGWSSPLILNDLMMSYHMHQNEQAIDLAPAAPFRNYIKWLDGQDKFAGNKFWTDYLSNLSGATDIGVTKRFDPEALPEPKAENVTLSVDLSNELRELAKRSQTTLSTVMQAAWGILLHRYSGDRHVVFGETVSGRPATLEDVEDMVGMFINSLPVCLTIDRQTDIVTWLQQIRKESIERNEYAYMSLAEVQKLSPFGGSGNLFDSLMVVENIGEGAADAEQNVDDDDAEEASGGMGMDGDEQINYDIGVKVVPGHQIKLELMYWSHRFEDSTMQQIMQHFVHIIEGLADEKHRRIEQVPIMTAEQVHQVLESWNNDVADYAKDKTIPQLFEQQAERTPDAIAIDHQSMQLTYAQLNTQANQVAHGLKAQGLATEQLVGLCVERSPLLIVAMLGIMKAGGAYVPLDPTYPVDRLQQIIESSQLSIAITTEQSAGQIASANAELMYIDTFFADGDNRDFSTENLSVDVANIDAENLAYVIFTSGSTGRPKGVSIEHHNVSALITWGQLRFGAQSDYGLGDGIEGEAAGDLLSGVLAVTSICFDLSIFEIWVPLCSGGRTILVDSALDFDGIDAAQNIKVINTVPSAMKILLDHKKVPSTVRVVNLAGEALPRSLVDEIYTATTAEAVYNLYGPSEDTTYSTEALIPKDETTAPLIGHAITNGRVYVLDNEHHLVPPLVVGEIYVAGAGVSRGYYGQDDLTLERFITDPFMELFHERGKHDARMYATGDLGRWLPDGSLQYLGRIDHQVKIRGFRIELGEVESSLKKADDRVKEAVVVAREEEQCLFAYVELTAPLADDEEKANTANELRQTVKAKLPDYMVPAIVMVVDAIPRTANGKVDRKALPEPELGYLSGEYVEPSTDTEQQLAELWAVLLGMDVQQVSAKANFFALGGHSILSMRLLAKVREIFNVELTIREIFSAETLAVLASLIENSHARAVLPAIQRYPRESNRLPVSFAQERMWFIDHMLNGSPQYNMPQALRIFGQFDVSIAEQAFQQIIQRHEPLRTVFERDGERVQQVILEQVDFAITVQDFRELAPELKEEAIMTVLNQDAQKAFDLKTDLMLRVGYLQLSETEGVLHLNIHHIASDGWSMDVLFSNFSEFYDAINEQRSVNLPELTVSYADVAQWQREWLDGEMLQSQHDYWEKQLANLPQVHELPLDYPRPIQQGSDGALAVASLDTATVQKLQALGQQHQASLFMVLHAAYSVLLARHSRNEDVVLGMTVANRKQAEVEALIGFFVNTLVLRTEVDADATFHELLEQVRQINLDAQDNQDVPFETLVERLKPTRSTSHTPLFQLAISMNVNLSAANSEENVSDDVEGDTDTDDDTGFDAVSFGADSVSENFDITLTLDHNDDGLQCIFSYDTDLFTEQTMQRLAEQYVHLLAEVAANASKKVVDYALHNPEQQQQLLAKQPAVVDYPAELSIVGVFQQQAQATPEAIALVTGDEGMSYQDLDEISNRFAHYLVAQGVQPQQWVGLAVNRGTPMLVAVLGILKAGAGYAPLDPSYPESRLSHMIDDMALPIILTQPQYMGQFAPSPCQCIDIEALEDALEEYSSAPLTDIEITPQNIAYINYTSGSTGKPKGVIIAHSGVVRLVKNNPSLPYSADTVTLQHSTASFDAATMEFWGPLLNGGRLVCVPGLGFDMDAILAHIKAYEINTLMLTTGLFDQLANYAEHLETLQWLMTGGEAMRASVVSRIYNVLPNVRIINCYGPTENTTMTTAFEVPRDWDERMAIPIGTPVNATQCYVMAEDSNGQLTPVPEGAVGELLTSGPGLAHGYLNLPEQTQESFVSCDLLPNQRLYRTGDLVRQMPDGNYYYLGRADQQVKLRGFRIELSEIEQTLLTLDGVKQVALTINADAKRLIAYVVSEYEAEGEADRLRALAKAALPSYMVPAAFVMMDNLPVTGTGKVDRKALPEPDASAFVSSEYVAPETETEIALASVWEALLDVSPIGRSANFFELGGHSLLVVRLQHALKVSFDVDVEVAELFNESQLSAMAALVDAKRVVDMIQTTVDSEEITDEGWL